MSAILAAAPPTGAHLAAYAIFLGIIIVLLALDLGVFHRKAHAPTFKEALRWTFVWVSVALAFNVLVYVLYENHIFGLGTAVPVLGKPGEVMTVTGFDAAKTFLTGYLVEYSLSMDNVFVIAVIFTSLGIPERFHHRMLFWGILGALIFRGAMIAVGAALIAQFAWITYVFGGFLILTALKMALVKDHAKDPSVSPIVRALKRFVPVTDQIHDQRFFVRIDGKRFATPLFVALCLVEFTDVIFAVDSVPAIFAITADPFLVFTSNVMAILGLRSLFFCLSAMIGKFRFLKPALELVLMFIGIKMCLVHTPLKIPTDVSLMVVLGTLAVAVIASLAIPAAEAHSNENAAAGDAHDGVKSSV